MSIKEVPTTKFPDTKAGTSGLRKKVTVFSQPNYVENWLQGLFNSLTFPAGQDKSLVVGGDGRYYNDVVVQKVLKVAIANGYTKLVVGVNGIISTPAVSAIIRDKKLSGGVILTASHNPGGPTQDFGIKYNISSGAPAPENVINLQYDASQNLTSYKILEHDDFDISKVATYDAIPGVTIEVVDGTEIWYSLIKTIFDFDLIRSLFKRSQWSFIFDALHGVTGPYAERLFKDLGAAPGSLSHSNILPDFGGLHPDPNQVYAHDLVTKLYNDKAPVFGAACDGDGDRNMILGKNFFVNPADSLAVIVDNADTIPYFKSGIKGVARSSPTAGTVDLVAKAKNLQYFETPTGWKFFGNLMDAGKLSICGEESFGTGSDHIREKDGLWAILAWLSIIATRSSKLADANAVVSVQDIVVDHWKKYGRYFIQRYDYEGLDTEKGLQVYHGLRDLLVGKSPAEVKELSGDPNLKSVDVFNYTDPIDKSYSPNNGLRFYFEDGSRFVVRTSGTSSSGITLRVYFEKYTTDAAKLLDDPAVVLLPLITTFLRVSKFESITGVTKPTVIT